MAKRRAIRNGTAEFLIALIKRKELELEVLYKNQAVWCARKVMSLLFDWK